MVLLESSCVQSPPGTEQWEVGVVNIRGMYRIQIPVFGKIPPSGKILQDNISVFEIGETGVKTLE